MLAKDYRVITLRVVNGSQVNYCYLIIDLVSKDAIAIDPAWEEHTIVATLQEHQANLKAILLTHHHKDHIDLAEPLAQRFGAGVVVSHAEAEFYGLRLPNLHTFTDDNTRIRIGSIEAIAWMTPGHTKGSCCYWVHNHLFTGDTLFNEGCGICIGPGASIEGMYNSLQTIKERVNDETRIYPGHRYHSDIGLTYAEVYRNNIYLGVENLDQFTRFRMRTPKKKLFDFK